MSLLPPHSVRCREGTNFVIRDRHHHHHKDERHVDITSIIITTNSHNNTNMSAPRLCVRRSGMARDADVTQTLLPLARELTGAPAHGPEKRAGMRQSTEERRPAEHRAGDGGGAGTDLLC